MMNLTITEISRKSVNTKYGPKVMLSLKTKEYPDRYMSGFQSEQNAHWQNGATVSVESVSEKAGSDGRMYLNFYMPKIEKNGNGQGGLSTEDRKLLNDILFNTQEIMKKLNSGGIGISADEMLPDEDVPF